MIQDAEQTFKAVYVSFQTILNVAERMRTDGSIPARVDRSYLGNASGTTKAQFLAAAKSLRFLDDNLKPTETFQEFVREPERRPAIVAELLRTYYAPILALGTNATQAQLDETFREEYNISGTTVRKAVAFFLAAAKFAKIEVSPHYTMPRTSPATSSGTRRKRGAPKAIEDSPPTPTGDPMAALRTKYIETLLEKFAQSNGDVDAELANRIERLMDFPTAERTE